MLWALAQFGSLVLAVNRPSPPTARTRASGPRTALSKRVSSQSSLASRAPATNTILDPMTSSSKIGPSCLAKAFRLAIGACRSSESAWPKTGLRGGCGMGWAAFAIGGSRAFDGERHAGSLGQPVREFHPERRRRSRHAAGNAGAILNQRDRALADHLRGRSVTGVAIALDADMEALALRPRPGEQ